MSFNQVIFTVISCKFLTGINIYRLLYSDIRFVSALFLRSVALHSVVVQVGYGPERPLQASVR